MPADNSDVMRIAPDAIPRLIAACEDGAGRVAIILNLIHRSGRIPAWTDDPISFAMSEHYNEQVFGFEGQPTPYTTYGAIRAYQQELVAVRDTLVRIQAEYERADSDAAARLA